MLTRRTLLESITALVLTPAGQERRTGAALLFQHDLPDLTLHNWAVTAVEVTYGPGEGSPSHRHPGITLAYVLEGEIRSKVGDGPEQTYSAGQMFVETPGQLHAVSRNASDTRPAKLLALLLAEKGKPLTTNA
jgi:quercetin dioxygenase-like cupin family protein